MSSFTGQPNRVEGGRSINYDAPVTFTYNGKQYRGRNRHGLGNT